MPSALIVRHRTSLGADHVVSAFRQVKQEQRGCYCCCVILASPDFKAREVLESGSEPFETKAMATVIE